MKYTLLFLFLFIASCFADRRGQLMNQKSTSVSIPLTIPNLRYWWVSSDLPTNTPATNWVDRIQGNMATNTAAASPTNSIGGIGFDGTTSLTFSNSFAIDLNNTGSVFIVMTPVTPAAAHCGLIASASGSGYGLFTTSGNNLEIFGNPGSGIISAFASGVTMDLSMVVTNTANGNDFFYTNAVSRPNILAGGFVGDSAFIGKSGIAGVYKGKIIEILVYSNALTSIQVSNLHFYATNLYSYSP